MSRIVVCLASLFFLAAVQAQEPVADKRQSAAPNALQPIERFNNRQMTLLKSGKPTSAHVTIRDWQIHGRQRIEKFPETGLLIIHLHSGRVTTSIRGREEKREPGDYWDVPAGTSMGVQVTSESASLHVMAINNP
jgi:quercetin dioxygenase-like cupin family protein